MLQIMVSSDVGIGVACSLSDVFDVCSCESSLSSLCALAMSWKLTGVIVSQ